MKLIIAGSRTIGDLSTGFIARYCPPEVDEVVSGMAEGPDQDGIDFAFDMSIATKQFPANWKEYGRAAGFLRNKEMGNYADSLLAFWDGESKGTLHMIEYMKQLKKPVRVILIQQLDKP